MGTSHSGQRQGQDRCRGVEIGAAIVLEVEFFFLRNRTIVVILETCCSHRIFITIGEFSSVCLEAPST